MASTKRQALLAIPFIYLSACTTVSTNDIHSIMGEWHVTSINNKTVTEPSTASLIFNDANRLSGNASCNNLMASYTITEKTISIGNTATTRMLCPSVNMKQEKKLLKVLPEIFFWSVQGNKLTLKNDANTTLLVAINKTNQ